MLCSNCQKSRTRAKRLCHACYQYQLTNAAPRPLRLINRTIDREVFDDLPMDLRIEAAKGRARQYARGERIAA